MGAAEGGDPVRRRATGSRLGPADDRRDLPVGEAGDVVVDDGLALLEGQRPERLPQVGTLPPWVAVRADAGVGAGPLDGRIRAGPAGPRR